MTTTDAFFLPGEAADPGYRNVRDLPHWHRARAFTEELWPLYRHLADSHFRSDARNHFNQRFWEMYLACTLMERGFKLHRAGREGPEFYFMSEGRRIWVEAIAPGPGSGADRVPETEFGKAYTVPTDKIVLRYTSALRDKLAKIRADTAKGIVNVDDSVLLGINSRGIPHAPFGGEMPYIIKAMLPFGALSVSIDTKTRKVVDTFHQYRPEVKKQNLAPVSTRPFLDPEYAVFSGILHSSVDCANHPDSLGEEFLILHNPTAKAKIDRSLFRWCRQFEYENEELSDIPREV